MYRWLVMHSFCVSFWLENSHLLRLVSVASDHWHSEQCTVLCAHQHPLGVFIVPSPAWTCGVYSMALWNPLWRLISSKFKTQLVVVSYHSISTAWMTKMSSSQEWFWRWHVLWLLGINVTALMINNVSCGVQYTQPSCSGLARTHSSHSIHLLQVNTNAETINHLMFLARILDPFIEAYWMCCVCLCQEYKEQGLQGKTLPSLC